MYSASDELGREELLDEVIAAYLNDEASGNAPTLPELLSRYPNLAADLERFFLNREVVGRFVTPLRAMAALGHSQQGKKAVPLSRNTRSLPLRAGVDPKATIDQEVSARAGDQHSQETTLDVRSVEDSEVTSIEPDPMGLHWWLADGDYEVLEELGRGGMGIVFKARQRSLKRLVALKVMRAGLAASSDERARFRHEAEAVARLQHPNIVQIHEVGEQEGCPFICFEFVGGGNLQYCLTGAPLEHRAAAELVTTLARAVHFAHQHGIVHRDLKPANILLQRKSELRSASSSTRGLASDVALSLSDFEPKLTDFGLAKRLDAELGHTHSGVILGTPSYMAPEQAGGQSKTVGPTADIYSLGATLYELVTGRPPFRAATTLDTVIQVLHADPIPPQRLQSTCPRDLETIILKCLQKAPVKRYASADALADDLRRFLDGEPITARPASAWERTIKWARRRPAVAALAAAVSLALVVLVGVVVGYNFYLRHRVDRAVAQEQQTQEEKKLAEKRAEDAEKGKQLAALRAECGPILEQAESALERGGLESAESLADKTRVRCGKDSALADLWERADRIANRARHLRLLFQGRDDALFHLYRQMFTGLDAPDSLAAAQQTAHKALNLFEVASETERGPVLDSSYNEREKEQIRLVSFELLLILAEATAREGQSAADVGSLHRAVRVLDRANRLVPSTKSYHVRRSRYLGILGDAENARKERVVADDLKPVSALDALVVGTDRWLVEGKPEEAVRYIDQAQREKSDLLWAPFFLAIAHLRTQEVAQAKAYLTVFINRKPDFVWAYLFRGSIHGELGEFDAAESDFAHAGRLHPEAEASTTTKQIWYVLHNNRGVMRIRQMKYGDAVADLQKAIALQPQQFHAYLSLAAAYRDQQQWELALDQLRLAIERKPKLALLYRDRAYVHLLRDDQVAALQDFETVIELEPAGPKTHKDHVERALIFSRSGKHQEGVQACAAALLLRPNYPEAHRVCGEILLAMKKYKEALHSFDRYLASRGVPVVEVFQARALAHAALNDFSAAIDEYTQAITLKPGDASLHAARGWAFLVNDSAKLALRDFEAAIKHDPNNGHAWNGRGYALARLGRYAEGVTDAREAVRLGPKTSHTYYNAARVFAQAAIAVEREADRPSEPREQLAVQYRDEAVDRLTDALYSLPDDEARARFWQNTVRLDSALMQPLRRSPRFVTLAARYEPMPQR
jgi:serine/threonine protein kinase/tetratricopeptide (TPR) repeat protein